MFNCTECCEHWLTHKLVTVRFLISDRNRNRNSNLPMHFYLHLVLHLSTWDLFLPFWADVDELFLFLFCSVLFGLVQFSFLLFSFLLLYLIRSFFYSRGDRFFFSSHCTFVLLLFCWIYWQLCCCDENRIKTLIICSTFRAVSLVRTCCLPQKIIWILEHSRRAKKWFRSSTIWISRFSNSIPVFSTIWHECSCTWTQPFFKNIQTQTRAKQRTNRSRRKFESNRKRKTDTNGLTPHGSLSRSLARDARSQRQQVARILRQQLENS